MKLKDIIGSLTAKFAALAVTFGLAAGAWGAAQIGDTPYATLAEAVAAVRTDGTMTTITMVDDEDTSSIVTIPEGANISLVGGAEPGHQVGSIVNNGTLTLKGYITATEIANNNVASLAYITTTSPGYVSAERIVNRGALTQSSAYTTIRVTESIVNYGAITNSLTSGTSVIGNIINHETLVISGSGSKVAVNYTTIEGSIVNYGTLNVQKSTSSSSTAHITGKIYNYYQMIFRVATNKYPTFENGIVVGDNAVVTGLGAASKLADYTASITTLGGDSISPEIRESPVEYNWRTSTGELPSYLVQSPYGKYMTFKEAWDDVMAHNVGNSIDLLADVTLDEVLVDTFTRAGGVNLHLNGHTLTVNANGGFSFANDWWISSSSTAGKIVINGENLADRFSVGENGKLTIVKGKVDAELGSETSLVDVLELVYASGYAITEDSTNIYVQRASDVPAVVHVDSIALDKTEMTLAIGETNTLTATISPANATEQFVVWSAGDINIAGIETPVLAADIATIKVFGQSAGTAYISARPLDWGEENPENYVCCTVTVTRSSNFYQDANDEDILHIANLAGLQEFRNEVNAGNSFKGKTVILDANIDMSSIESWDPIGQDYETVQGGDKLKRRFEGTFDGNNKTLSNLTINDNTHNEAGLFGVTGYGSTFKDLTLDSPTVNGRIGVGTLAGTLWASSVVNCHVTGDITVTGYQCVGGLAGSDSYTVITGCSVIGDDKATSVITGNYAAGIEDGDNIGGLVGMNGPSDPAAQKADQATSNCSVGNLTLRGWRKVGGLSGQSYNRESVYDCSVGDIDIICLADTTFATTKEETLAFGGMVGIFAVVPNDTQYRHAENSYLEGTVSNVTITCANDAVNEYAKMGIISGGQRGDTDFVEPTDTQFNVTVSGTNSTSGTKVSDNTDKIYSAKPLADYVTLTLTIDDNYAATYPEKVAAARAMYEGVKYESLAAAQAGFAALFGWTGTGYANPNNAPFKNAVASNGPTPVTKVTFDLYGTTAVGTSDGKITLGNFSASSLYLMSVDLVGHDGAEISGEAEISAKVAGGYDNHHTTRGKFFVTNIVFTTSSDKVEFYASCANIGATEKVVEPSELEVVGCTFHTKIYEYSNSADNGKMTYSFHDNVFISTGSETYALHIQSGTDMGPDTINFYNNIVSNYVRGININVSSSTQTKTANIYGNTFYPGVGYSAVQLSTIDVAFVTNNVIYLDAGNAITLHEYLNDGAVVHLDGNTIAFADGASVGYIVYDDAYAGNKADALARNLTMTYTGNTVAEGISTTQGVKGADAYGLREYVYNVLNPVYVAQIGDDKYATIADAIAAVPNNTATTITILADVDLGTLTQAQVTAAGNAGLITIPAGKVITLDLNGHRLYGTLQEINSGYNKNHVLLNSGTLTVVDSGVGGSIENLGTGCVDCCYTIENASGATMYLNGGTFSTASGALMINRGTCEINSGVEMTCDGWYRGAYSNASSVLDNRGTVTINGGTFESTHEKASNGKEATATIFSYNSTTIINGGTFIGQPENGVFGGGDGNYTITGGSFSSNPQNLVDSTAYYIRESSGMYTVSPIVIENYNVATSAELLEKLALADAESRFVKCKLTDDITLSANAAVAHGSQIDLNGNTLTVGDGVILSNAGTIVDGTGEGAVQVSRTGFLTNPYGGVDNDNVELVYANAADENGVYEISTPMDLQWLSYFVNTGDFIDDVTKIVFADDIAIPSGVGFEMIGGIDNKEIDGNGKSVSGVVINGISGEYGMFEYLAASYVHDLDVTASVSTVNAATGILAARIEGGTTVKNVTVNGRIDVSGTSFGVAGFAGAIGDGSGEVRIVNCTNNADIDAPLSQIAGGFHGTSTSFANGIYYIGCENTGDVTSGLYAAQSWGYGYYSLYLYDFTGSGTMVGDKVFTGAQGGPDGKSGNIITAAKVARTGTPTSPTFHDDLASAITAAAANSSTIMLLKDCADAYELTVGSTLVIDEVAGECTGITAPSGYVVEKTVSGTIATYSAVVAPVYVAQIGTTKYESLAAAILAAQNGDTIEILDGTWGADAVGTMTTSEKLSVRAKSLTIQPAEGATPKFTADVSLGYDDSSTRNAAITVKGLVFENASLLVGNYAQTTVEGCTFSNGALRVIESCSSNYNRENFVLDQVTIKDCSFDGTQAGDPAIRVRNGGNVLITGNIIRNSAHNGILLESNSTVNKQVEKTIVIEGNEITEWNAGNVADGGRGIRADLGTMAAGSTVTVDGNVFRKETTGLDSPDFVKITNVGSGTVDLSGNDWNDMLLSEVKGNSAIYTCDVTATLDSVITTKVPVARIGTTEYESLAAAVAAAQDGDTVELIADCAVSEQVSVSKSINIDGNGFTVTSGDDWTGSYVFYVMEEATATAPISCNVSDLKIVSTKHQVVFLLNENENVGNVLNLNNVDIVCDGECIYSNGRATVNAEDCEFKHEGVYATGKDNVYYSALVVGYSGVINATNCVVTSFGNGASTFPSGGKITLVGTEISVTPVEGIPNSGYALWARNEDYDNPAYVEYLSDSIIEVESGIIRGELKITDKYDSGDKNKYAPIIAISGGYFSTAVLAGYCATGYVPTTKPAANGLYTVTTPCTVTYTLADGDDSAIGAALPDPASFAYPSGDMAEIALAVATCTADGYTFAGWKVSGEGDAIAALPAGTTGNITLVATWTGAQKVTITESEESAEITVTDAWIEQNVTPAGEKATTAEIQEALNKKDANGLKAWENYVLGLDGSDPNANVAADAAQGPVSATPITSNVDVPAVDTGFKVEYKLVSVDTNGTTVTQSALQPTPDLTADIAAMTSETNVVYYKTVAVITSTDNPSVKVEVESTNTVGVLKVESEAKTTAIAVPWEALGGGDISVSNIVRTANLTPGDELKAYAPDGKYKAWELDANKCWQPVTVVGGSSETDADAFRVPRGSAVWLTRQDTTQPIYLVGEVAATEKAEVTLEAGTTTNPSWNLVGSSGTEPVNVAALLGDNHDDKVSVPTAYVPKNYEYVDGKWGYWDSETYEHTNKNGRVSMRVHDVFVTDDNYIPAGTGFWYQNSGAAATIDL